MSQVRLDLTLEEAELLSMALNLVINASSPELMKQKGWECAEDVSATTLIQNVFDFNNIETLKNIADVLNTTDFDFSEDVSQSDVTAEYVDDEDGACNGVNHEVENRNALKNNTNSHLTSWETNNIVSLDEFRNRTSMHRGE